MVAHNVVVIFEMGQHLFVVFFAVSQAKTIFNFDRISGPVQTGGFTHQGPAATVKHAADNVVLGVVIQRLRILIHIESGIAKRTMLKLRIGRVGQSLEVEGSEAFAVVKPIKHHGEFFVVHAIACKRDVGGFCQRELTQMPLP